MSLQDRFDKLLTNISLPATQQDRMDSARDAITGFLVNSYGIPAGRVFTQGSYANGTAIRPPEGGEYDLDIVCVCMPSAGESSDQALDELERRFRTNGNYAHRVKPKNPCVRLEYAEDDVGKFHVDVVPVRVSLSDAPLDAPHRQRGWHGTAPREYTAWCQQQGPLYVRTVMILKQWRNVQQPVRSAIKSIALQVLASQCMPAGQHDDAMRIAATFANLDNYLQRFTEPPEVWNPVLPSENLAATWSKEAFANFKAEIVEAREISQLASTVSEDEAAHLWSMLFGDEFPTVSKEDYGLQLGDHSHAHTPHQMGWTKQLDARYRVTFSARVYRGYQSKTYKPYRSDGTPILAGAKLRFEARPEGPSGYEIWWQVANTGGHARDNDGLRGDYFKAKAPRGGASTNPAVNWESTSYTGVHLIRPLLVVARNVVAKAPWMRVNIIAPQHRFRP